MARRRSDVYLKFKGKNSMLLRSTLLRIGFCACCALGLLTIAPVNEAQGLGSNDLSRLRSVGGVELSPDGRRIAYSVTMRDRPGRPYGQLWIMDRNFCVRSLIFRMARRDAFFLVRWHRSTLRLRSRGPRRMPARSASRSAPKSTRAFGRSTPNAT